MFLPLSLTYLWQKNSSNLVLLFHFIQEGKSPESGVDDTSSKNDHGQLSDEREESDPSDEEFPTFPGEERAVSVDEGDSATPEGEMLFEAGFEAPPTLLQKSLTEENVDLLGLNSDASPEQKEPISEINSSSNAALLNNLFVSGASQVSEEPTGDLLGQGADFFFSGQSQHPAVTQTSAAAASSGM